VPGGRTLHEPGKRKPGDHRATDERDGPLARELLDVLYELAHLTAIERLRHAFETFGRIA
jgi:hypothetical protein